MKYKKNIPNILTFVRIILTPIIIILGLFKQTHFIIILAICCALTDLLDGKLARKWNVVSKKGAKLDAFADKFFAIGLIASLIRPFHILLIPFILEIFTALSNLYYFKKLKESKSLMIGKIKINFLFPMIIIYMITLFESKFLILGQGFLAATINLQILCLIFYYQNYKREKNKLTVEDTEVHKNIMNDIDSYSIEKTLEVNDLIDLVQKYNLNSEEEKNI